jgi:hypothetical protein
MKTKLFLLVTVSSNTNSFGLRNHVFLARDGQAFEAARADGDYHRRQFEKGKQYPFTVGDGDDILLGLVYDRFEIPHILPKAPASVINEAFRAVITRPV